MIPAMPGQRGTVPLDDPRRWAEKGREARPLGLPPDPRLHEALADLLGSAVAEGRPLDRVIPHEVAAAWREGYAAAEREQPHARTCRAPACDHGLPTYPDRGWRGSTCSERCQRALSRARLGEGERRRQQGR